MADTMFFSRDSKIFVAPLAANGTEAGVWEIPVLDGFSFSQATNTSEVTLNEMSADTAGTSRRGRKMFTDSYAPAEWSFSTYARPFKSAGGTPAAANGLADATANNHHAVEEVLWAMTVGNAIQTSHAFQGFTIDTDDLDITFANSNKTTLGKANIYFVLGGTTGETTTVYKLENCCVNEVGIDFDIDGITTLNWSGMGTIITEITTAPTRTRYEGAAATDTGNFIRNRLTNLVASSSSPTSVSAYNLTLTGGSITISNNMTFLTPETLGVVNQPLDHVTGTRTVSGSFTCYLNSASDSSMDLFENIIEGTTTVTNDFDLKFQIGGTSAPRMEMHMAACHLEVPTHAIDDVISLEVNFHALGTDIESTDELTVKYVGA
jgi:hypothetical protein